MTIVTKPITEKKGDKLVQPLVDNKINETKSLGNEGDVEANNAALMPRYMVQAHRLTTATTVCLFLTALLVMSVGIISGVYIYRQFARSQMHRFRGWCAIPYESNLLLDDGMQSIHRDNRLADSRLIKSVLQDTGRMGPSESFKEEFEIDLEFESYEKINVPDFRSGRTGRFIHDFNANKTGIVDLEGHRCFVMPLNRDLVLPPRSLLDLISKIWEGYYEVNTETVRETMKVVLPPIKDYRKVGIYISRECLTMPTYMLEKVTVPVYKRSVGDVATFGEFAGHNIQEVNIVNMAALEEFERSNDLQQSQE